MLGNSLVAEQLVAYQEGLSSMELGSLLNQTIPSARHSLT
jgi:hypothetical protein